jgi:uncharacterized coiled-coil protein SlyX
MVDEDRIRELESKVAALEAVVETKDRSLNDTVEQLWYAIRLLRNANRKSK